MNLRPGRSSDYTTFVKLFAELGVDDPIPLSPKWERGIMPTMLVAEEGSRALGYVFYQLFEDAAHVRHLVSAPDARRRGVGRALMNEVRRVARDAGRRAWRLNVEPRNSGAIALYESLGLARAFESQSLTLAWSAIDALPMSASTRSKTLAASDDDARAELAMNVANGQLTVERARGRDIIAIEEGDAIVAVAAFDRAFPGASPFRVARAELAVTLLQSIRVHAPSDSVVHVMIEDRPDVASALRALGAAVRLEVVHMRGAL